MAANARQPMPSLLIMRTAPTVFAGAADVNVATARGLRTDAFARVRHHGTQLLAGLEDRDRACSYLEGVPGARIAGHADLALADLKRAKPAYLKVKLLGKGRFDRIDEGIDHA